MFASIGRGPWPKSWVQRFSTCGDVASGNKFLPGVIERCSTVSFEPLAHGPKHFLNLARFGNNWPRAMQYFSYLDDDDIACVHESSLEILEEVGLLVRNEKARKRFAEHGARVDQAEP